MKRMGSIVAALAVAVLALAPAGALADSPRRGGGAGAPRMFHAPAQILHIPNRGIPPGHGARFTGPPTHFRDGRFRDGRFHDGRFHGFPRHHGGAFIGFGVGALVTAPFWYPPPVYAYPAYPVYAYPAYPPPAPAPAPAYWYYCQDPPGYYPYVTQCPGGWTPVVPQPAPGTPAAPAQ